MKVKNIYFIDEIENNTPIFELENGEILLPVYTPTGSCWMLGWIKKPKKTIKSNYDKEVIKKFKKVEDIIYGNR